MQSPEPNSNTPTTTRTRLAAQLREVRRQLGPSSDDPAAVAAAFRDVYPDERSMANLLDLAQRNGLLTPVLEACPKGEAAARHEARRMAAALQSSHFVTQEGADTLADAVVDAFAGRTDGPAERADGPADGGIYCPMCGWENSKDAHFCGQCGTDLTTGSPLAAGVPATPAATRASSTVPAAPLYPAAQPTAVYMPPVPAPPAPTAPVPTPPVPTAPVPAQALQQGSRGMGRGTVVAIVCAILAVFLVAGIVGTGGFSQGFPTRATSDSEAGDPVDIGLTIEAPNYTEGATRIPLRVKGTDISGNTVNQVQYVSTNSTRLSLLQGDYTVNVEASPILEDGSLYVVPETVVTVVVRDEETQEASESDQSEPDQTEPDQSSETELNQADQQITFTICDPEDVTDEMIEEAKEVALQDEQSKDKVEDLVDKAIQKRDEAVQEQQEQAEPDEQAQEEAHVDEEAHAQQQAQEDASSQAKIQRVQDNALDYVKTYYNSVTLSEPLYDSSGTLYYDMLPVDDWPSNCLQYVEEGSWVYDSLTSSEPGSLGAEDVWLVLESATVTNATESDALVDVSYYAGNGNLTENATPLTTTLWFNFDDDGLINEIIGPTGPS